MNETIQMPKMPAAPKLNRGAAKNKDQVQMPTIPIVDEGSAGAQNLKPKIVDPSSNDSEIDIPLVPKSGIEVVATRKGFFNQDRKKAGSTFTVLKFEELGEWMECVDPAIEKKRVEFFKKKKMK